MTGHPPVAFGSCIVLTKWHVLLFLNQGFWDINMQYRISGSCSLLPLSFGVFLRCFLYGPSLKSLLNSLQYCFYFVFWLFGRKACGILSPLSGTGPTAVALEGKVSTTGLPGKPLPLSFKSELQLDFLVGSFPSYKSQMLLTKGSLLQGMFFKQNPGCGFRWFACKTCQLGRTQTSWASSKKGD